MLNPVETAACLTDDFQRSLGFDTPNSRELFPGYATGQDCKSFFTKIKIYDVTVVLIRYKTESDYALAEWGKTFRVIAGSTKGHRGWSMALLRVLNNNLFVTISLSKQKLAVRKKFWAGQQGLSD